MLFKRVHSLLVYLLVGAEAERDIMGFSGAENHHLAILKNLLSTVSESRFCGVRNLFKDLFV